MGVLKRGEDYTVADPGFQARGEVHLKILHRVQGGANIFGVFCVKNNDFMPNKSYFFQF